jgi:metal transporter CNNM
MPSSGKTSMPPVRRALSAVEIYCHRPVIVSETNARMGDVMGRMKVKTNNPEDDVIDNDLILVWGKQKRIITGSDILGRLLRGISSKENKPN